MIGFFMPPRHRKGHHGDYLKFLTVYWSLHQPPVFDTLSAKIRAIVRHPGCLVALDPDKSDLLALLIAAFRNRLHPKPVRIVGISVRSGEFLHKSRSTTHLILHRGRVTYLKAEVKKRFFRFIKNTAGLELLSIHLNEDSKRKLLPYYSGFVRDFQYYDLPYLNIEAVRPPESTNDNFPIETAMLVFMGSNTERRNLDALQAYVSNPERHTPLVLVGSSLVGQDSPQHCLMIPRYVSNGELLWLMQACKIVYTYYSNQAPSGFFGRATQMGKWVVVQEGGYLHREGYPRTIALHRLMQLEEFAFPSPGPNLVEWQERMNNPSEQLRRPC